MTRGNQRETDRERAAKRGGKQTAKDKDGLSALQRKERYSNGLAFQKILPKAELTLNVISETVWHDCAGMHKRCKKSLPKKLQPRQNPRTLSSND